MIFIVKITMQVLECIILIPNKGPKYRTVRLNTGHLATLNIKYINRPPLTWRPGSATACSGDHLSGGSLVRGLIRPHFTSTMTFLPEIGAGLMVWGRHSQHRPYIFQPNSIAHNYILKRNSPYIFQQNSVASIYYFSHCPYISLLQ